MNMKILMQRKILSLFAIAMILGYGQCEQCVGKHLHPLDTKNLQTHYLEMEEFVQMDFLAVPKNTILWNNGQTLVITMDFENNTPVLSKGVLAPQGKFRFAKMYLHWLEKPYPKYNYNKIQLPAELHVVFYNTKHANMEDAMTKYAGVAIVAYTIRIHPSASYGFDDVTSELVHVRQANSKKALSEDELQPLYMYLSQSMSDYWTYHGTLIQNSCVNDVIWIDVKSPLVMKPEFAEEVGRLQAANKQPLTKQVIQYDQPVGVILTPYKNDSEEENKMSSIPFVDTYDTGHSGSGYGSGFYSENVGFFVFVGLVLSNLI